MQTHTENGTTTTTTTAIIMALLIEHVIPLLLSGTFSFNSPEHKHHHTHTNTMAAIKPNRLDKCTALYICLLSQVVKVQNRQQQSYAFLGPRFLQRSSLSTLNPWNQCVSLRQWWRTVLLSRNRSKDADITQTALTPKVIISENTHSFAKN